MPEWVTYRECWSIDFFALRCWSSGYGHMRVGYEVKVSRSDFQADLRKPHEHRRARAVCHRFYYVAPKGGVGAEKPYALLVKAMERAGKVAIGRFVLRTKEYLAAATFQDMRFNPLTMYREVKDLMSDDDGQVHKDWRMTSDAELRADATLLEQIVAPGDQVTAIGKYSAEKDGLVPDLANPLRLIRGDAQVVAGSLWKKAASTVIGAIILLFVLGKLALA